MGLGVPLQDANGGLLKIGGFTSNFLALMGKKINIGVGLNVQKGNFEFSTQIDPKTWDLGAGLKAICRLKQTLPARSPAELMVGGQWLMVELVSRSALL